MQNEHLETAFSLFAYACDMLGLDAEVHEDRVQVYLSTPPTGGDCGGRAHIACFEARHFTKLTSAGGKVSTAQEFLIEWNDRKG
jgi:hypothetical protein